MRQAREEAQPLLLVLQSPQWFCGPGSLLTRVSRQVVQCRAALLGEQSEVRHLPGPGTFSEAVSSTHKI